MHTWTFILEDRSHRIDFWDSRISGKKKLALDGNELKLVKDTDNFYFAFKIDGYNFIVFQKSDEQFEIKINNRVFSDLLRDERNGNLQREKENYLKRKDKDKDKKKNNRNEDDYYKRAMKYNGDNYFEGDEIYDIEEQRKRLEEFEKKKREKEKLSNKKVNNYNDDFNGNKGNNGKKNFILDVKTVNQNRMIISKLNDIFGKDDFQDGDNLFELNWKNDNDNNNNFNQNNNNQDNFMKESMFNNNYRNNNNYNKNILDSNPDYYLNQMTNNLNNAKNPHNQAVLDQFFDLTNNNYNSNNNNNMNFNNNSNNNNFNMQFQNNNYSNQNNTNNMMPNNFMQNNMMQNNQVGNNGNNNYNDDFNPFDDD